MIKKNALTLIFLFMAGLLLFTSCEDIIDDDDDPAVDKRDKYIGSWKTTETSTLYPQPNTFSVEIDYDENSTQIRLYNIYQLGSNVYAEAIVTGNSFTIPHQEVNNMVLEGYAEMKNENRIEIEYTVNDGADVDEVIGEMERLVPSIASPYIAMN